MIILGDAGINFSGPRYDRLKKRQLEELPITIFAIHGNHEQRPFTIESYKEQVWNGGMVYYEEEFPSILFAKDGVVYNLNGLKTIVMGGAYSIDKAYRLAYGYGWWEDEQPSDEIKKYVEEQLEREAWDVDVVLSHTTPLKYEPVEVFMSGVDQSKVDKSTENWLDKIEDRLSYKKWYDRLIQLCDALALPDGATYIEKRLVDVVMRRGFNDLTIPKWKAFFDLKDYFDKKMGTNLYLVISI